MNSKQFYSNCRDLVRVRWTFVLGENGCILLVPRRFKPPGCSRVTCSYDREIPERWCDPIRVVAHDVKGFIPQADSDVWKAAELLELPKDFATRAFAASSSAGDFDDDTAEIRRNLIHSLVGEDEEAPLSDRVRFARSSNERAQWATAAASFLDNWTPRFA